MRAARALALIETMAENENDILLMEPRADFDECVIGVVQRFHSVFALYSTKCVLEVLARDAPDDDPDYPPDLSAREYFEFNTVGAWVGEATPGFLMDEDDEEEPHDLAVAARP